MSDQWLDELFPVIDDQGNFNSENFKFQLDWNSRVQLYKYRVNIKGQAPKTVAVTEKQHKLSRDDYQAYLSMIANALSISKTLIEGAVYIGKVMKK